MAYKDYIYPVVIPAAHMKPEYRKMKLTSKYILSRIIGLSKRCELKQLRISNSLLKYEVDLDHNQISRAFKELEDLKLIKIDWKNGCRRIVNVLFDIDDLRVSDTENQPDIKNDTVNEMNSVQNEHSSMHEMNSVQNEQCTDRTQNYVQNEHSSMHETNTHKYEYKIEEIDIYRKKVYRKILKDLSEGSIEKIFMRDPETNNQLASFIPFSFDPKEDVDRDGQCIYTNEALDEEGYNLHQWIATNITYLADLCLIGKYGEDAYSIYAESLLKRWNPKKASLGKFLNVAVQNDFKGFRTKAIDYVQSNIDREIVSPVLKKFIKQRNSPSKVLDAIAFDYPQYFTAVMHDMDLGRYLYRLMYEVIKGDCEDVYTPYDSNRDFPTDEERAFDWGQQWFDAWSTDPQCLNKEAQEIALGIKPLHKELYGKEVMFDAFFD